MPFNGYYKGRKVLITGHTGFKGAWLAWWLGRLGAEVAGISLEPPSRPNLFEALGVGETCLDRRRDIRAVEPLTREIGAFKPEVVFHMAAQSLVRRGYGVPLETLDTNIMGTANVIEAARKAGSVAALVAVTTDKCYRNDDRGVAFAEDDPLGGHDPYSASKAAAEMVVTAYRSITDGTVPPLASVRAGNVIGGGDWAEDRLVPDMVRAFAGGRPAEIRQPHAVRPWQHVLEPLAGYLELGHRLAAGDATCRQAFNLGPDEAACIPVSEVAEAFLTTWKGGSWKDVSAGQGGEPREAKVLRLSNARAVRDLGWRPLLDVATALEWTSEWYRAYHQGDDIRALTDRQIDDYTQKGREAGLPWGAA